jgi:uncharacterized protein (TIGR02996 family)
MAHEPIPPRRLAVDASADQASAGMAASIGPEEDHLLAAVCDASSEDDEPRLVYGDWLLDRGDPRGELIITQCTLSRMADDDPGRGALEHRVEELLARYREPWFGGIEDLEKEELQRGFLEGLMLSASTLARHADRLWRLSPCRRLHLFNIDSWAQLTVSPALARYRELACSRIESDDQLIRLASSPYVAGLESLYIEDCDIGDDGLIALSRAPLLRKLRSLEIGLRMRRPAADADGRTGFCLSRDLSLTGFSALAEASFAPRLERLRIQDRRLGEDLVPVLAAFPMLVELDLSGTRLGESGTIRLAALPLRPRRLGLAGNAINSGGAYALACSPILDSIEVLDVSSNPMDEAGALALVTSPHLRALRCLVCNGTDGIPNAAVAAAIARSLPQLEELVLPFAKIGPEGAAALAASDLPNLARLELFGNEIGDAGAVAFARSTTLPALRSLDLSDNGLTDAGALALAESPHLAELDYLRIRSTSLGQRAVGALRARFGRRVDVKDPPSP